MLIRPDDVADIHQNLDQAAGFARQYSNLPESEQDHESRRKLIADGQALRSRLEGIAQESNCTVQDEGVLVWRPTGDRLGATATHGETVYVVHAAGNPRHWRCGIGDGANTEWFEARFANEDLAKAAAQQHLDGNRVVKKSEGSKW